MKNSRVDPAVFWSSVAGSSEAIERLFKKYAQDDAEQASAQRDLEKLIDEIAVPAEWGEVCP